MKLAEPVHGENGKGVGGRSLLPSAQSGQWPCGGLAVVFGGGAWRETCGDVAFRSASPQRGLAGLGQPAAKRSGIGGLAEVHRTWHALRKRVVATCHGGAFGPGSKPSSARPPANPREKVECPLFPRQRTIVKIGAFHRSPVRPAVPGSCQPLPSFGNRAMLAAVAPFRYLWGVFAWKERETFQRGLRGLLYLSTIAGASSFFTGLASSNTILGIVSTLCVGSPLRS